MGRAEKETKIKRVLENFSCWGKREGFFGREEGSFRGKKAPFVQISDNSSEGKAPPMGRNPLSA